MPKTNYITWDLFIRVFHWSLVIAFTINYLTEGDVNLHFYMGWYIALILMLRVIWGFIGTKHARFIDFVKSPSEVTQYVKDMLGGKGTAEKFRGHNPLGGLMIIALLLSLSITSFSGVMLYTSQGNQLFSFTDAPLFSEYEEEEHYSIKQNSGSNALDEEYEEHQEYEEHDENESEELWEELHEFFANFTLLLILFHIVGVVLSSRLSGENLVKAMISGKKQHD